MRGLAAVWLLLALMAAPAAQPLVAERVISLRDGASGTLTQAVTLDADGFLWAGSQLGLDRWDGVRLRGVEVPGGVWALAAAPDGALWAAGREGLYHLASSDAPARRLVDASTADGPMGPHVRAVVPDGAGGAWVGTAGHGLAHVRPARGRYARVLGLPSDSVLALVAPARGWLWLGTPEGVVRLHVASRRPASPIRIGAVVGCTEAVPDAAADAAPRPVVWCATRDGRVHTLDAASGRVVRPAWSTGGEVSALAASRSRPGTVWIGTRGLGLLALDTGTGTLAPALGEGDPERADVLSLHEGPDGLLWIGAVGGLYRANTRPPPFAPGAALDGAPPVTALHVPRSSAGVLWLGTIRGGLRRLDRATGASRTWFDAPGHPLSVLFAIREDARGRLWLGGPRSAIYRFDPATGTTVPLTVSDAPGTVVYHLADDAARPGVLWVGMKPGLAEVDVDAGRVLRRWTADAPPPHRLDAENVWASVAGGDGTRWLATNDAGLVRLDLASGRTTPVGDACGLGRDVQSVTRTSDGTLWVARNGALVRYAPRDGSCEAFVPDDGTRSDLYGVTVDARGRVWATTRAAGLLRFDPATTTWARYTTADGLPTDEYFIPAHHLAPSGEWFVGGPGGWTSFRPDAIGAGAMAPRVVVTGLRVDGRPVEVPEGGALRLGAGENDLAVAFAALDFRRPDANRYRVRLDRAGNGAPPWTALGSRAEVRMPFLAPGRYALRVAGAGPDGRWAEAAPLAFVIRPPLWRRPWVWGVVLLALAGVVIAVQQARIRQLRREEATRRRIADDLHDDIGSKMSTVALRLDLVRRSPGLSDPDRTRLHEIERTARGVVVSLRDAVWVVDAGHDGLDALADRIETAARAVLDGRTVMVERPRALPELALPMETRRHVLLWAREALNNAAKYSTGRVRVVLADSPTHLSLSVEDDGPGFDPSEAGGRGLTTLSGRATAVGGTHTLDTSPGGRTRLTLTVPLPSRPRA